MFFDIIFSGFGGQGALFAGQLLAYAAMDEGRHVTWIPSYGPEMRGGTAHCVVIVSDEEIGSPLVRTPNTVIALNNPSAEKYEPLIAQHGHLIYNSSLTSHVVTRRNIHAIPIPGSEAAAELGHAKLLNMVMLGALLDRVPVLTLDALDRALEGHLPARRRDLLEANKLALRKGIELSQTVLIPA
ncbi:MAG: 2-oxoacid:acceptor oxidoreductase family protein [Chloroflexi bacterium]|nr:2-oxoacid:acceptor oxidoreductase family protein [Chloroflexota bacterium]